MGLTVAEALCQWLCWGAGALEGRNPVSFQAWSINQQEAATSLLGGGAGSKGQSVSPRLPWAWTGPSLWSEASGDRVISAALDGTYASLSSPPALKLNSDV